LLKAFKPQGAFAYYAVWNLIGFLAVLLFVPETKGLSLEELDQVFSIPTKKHAKYGLQQLAYFFQRFVLRRNVAAPKLATAHDEKYADNEAR